MSRGTDCRVCPGTSPKRTGAMSPGRMSPDSLERSYARPQMSPDSLERTYARPQMSPDSLERSYARPQMSPDSLERSYARPQMSPDSLERPHARTQMTPDSIERSYVYSRNATYSGGSATPTASRRPLPPRRPDFFNRTYNQSGSPVRYANQTYGTPGRRSPGGLSRSPHSLLRSAVSGGSRGSPGVPAVSFRSMASGAGTYSMSGRSPAGTYSLSGGSPAGTYSLPSGSPPRAYSRSPGSAGTYSLSRSPVRSGGASFRGPVSPSRPSGLLDATDAYCTAEDDFSSDSLEGDVARIFTHISGDSLEGELAGGGEFADECEGGAFRFINPRIVYSPYRPPTPRGPYDYTVLSEDVSPMGSRARALMSPRMITSTPKNAPPDVTLDDSRGCQEGLAHKVHAMWNPDDTFKRWATIKTWDLEKEIQWRNLLQRLCYDNNCRRDCHVGLEGKLQSAINALYDPGGFNVGVKMIYDLLKRNKDLDLMPHFEGMAQDKIAEIILGLNKEQNADPNPEPEDCTNITEAEMEMIAATNELLTSEGSEPVQLSPKYFNMLLEWYIRRNDSEEESAGSANPFDSLM